MTDKVKVLFNPVLLQQLAQKIAEEFEDTYETARNEIDFCFMTEEESDKERTVITACEKIVCELKGVTFEDYVNETNGVIYNDIWTPATDLASSVMDELKRDYYEKHER